MKLKIIEIWNISLMIINLIILFFIYLLIDLFGL